MTAFDKFRGASHAVAASLVPGYRQHLAQQIEDERQIATLRLCFGAEAAQVQAAIDGLRSWELRPGLYAATELGRMGVAADAVPAALQQIRQIIDMLDSSDGGSRRLSPDAWVGVAEYLGTLAAIAGVDAIPFGRTLYQTARRVDET